MYMDRLGSNTGSELEDSDILAVVTRENELSVDFGDGVLEENTQGEEVDIIHGGFIHLELLESNTLVCVFSAELTQTKTSGNVTKLVWGFMATLKWI